MAPGYLTNFMLDEGGAVTVDWVVLTGAIVGLSISVFTIITRDSVTVGGQIINDKLDESATTNFLQGSNPQQSPSGGGG